MWLLDTDTPRLQCGPDWHNFIKIISPPLSKLSGSGKGSNPGPCHSEQGHPPCRHCTTQSQRFVGERKDLFFPLASMVHTCEIWGCGSQFTA